MDTVQLPGVFATARLRAERFTPAHEPELAVMDGDMTVQATLFGRTYDAAETHERALRRAALWAEYGYGDYLVRDGAGTFVGFAGLFPSPRPRAVAVGYALRPAFWGRGYATELAIALTGLARTLGRREIVATVLPDNRGSRRVLEKAGFVLIGTNPDDVATVIYRYAAAP